MANSKGTDNVKRYHVAPFLVCCLLEIQLGVVLIISSIKMAVSQMKENYYIHSFRRPSDIRHLSEFIEY